MRWFVLNYVPDTGSIVRPVKQQSSALPLYHGCPHFSPARNQPHLQYKTNASGEVRRPNGNASIIVLAISMKSEICLTTLVMRQAIVSCATFWVMKWRREEIYEWKESPGTTQVKWNQPGSCKGPMLSSHSIIWFCLKKGDRIEYQSEGNTLCIVFCNCFMFKSKAYSIFLSMLSQLIFDPCIAHSNSPIYIVFFTAFNF